MIIKNDFFNNNNSLEQECEGIKKAVKKLDSRFQNNEIDREKFLKQNAVFAERHELLKKKIAKLNKK